MKRFAGMAAVLILTSCAWADLKVTFETREPNHHDKTTIYVKGQRVRTEATAGRHEFTVIHQYDLGRLLNLWGDGTYEVMSLDPIGDGIRLEAQAKELEVSRGLRTEDVEERVRRQRHGTVTHVERYEETGERRILFGREARRVRIEQHSEASEDACSTTTDARITIEGWFIDLPPELYQHPQHVPFTVGPPQETKQGKDLWGCEDRIEYKTIGKKRPALALLVTRTVENKVSPPVTMEFEVTDLSTAPLSADLFDVPTGGKQYRAEDEEAENTAWRKAAIQRYRNFFVPLKLAVSPIVIDRVERTINIDRMHSAMVARLAALGISIVDLDANDESDALTQARVKQADFIVKIAILSADVPDTAASEIPAYGNALLRFSLVDVPTAATVVWRPAAKDKVVTSGKTLETAFEYLAEEIAIGVGGYREERLKERKTKKTK